MNPITVDKGGFILNGNHRTAAAIENGDEYMLAFVEVGAGTGKITNLDEAIEALAGKAKKTTSKQVEKIDPPPATTIEPKTEAPQWNKLTKIGNQKGSNPGGMYQDTTTGKKYYIKEPGNDDIARNEVLAAKLYEAAGVEVPNVHLMNDGGTVRIASEIMEDLQQDATKLGSGKIQGVNDNFMVDAWLANWDVAGLGYDNLLIQGKKAIRIDVGGALRYRAQGGQKGAAFGKEVLEIESLRDTGMNPQSASVFAKASKEDMIAGARKVLALDKQQITELVDTFGPTTKKERTKLINTLVARQKHIAKQFPEAVKAPEPELPTSAPITRLEHEQVKNSRSNGYAVATDKADIEDHNVLIYQKKNLKGDDVTAAYFKLRPAAMRQLEKKISNLVSEGFSLDSMHEKMIKAIKAVAHRADMGNGMDDYVFGYIDAALEEYNLSLRSISDDIKKGVRSQTDMADFLAKAEPFYLQLVKTKDRTLVGGVPTWEKSLGTYTPFKIKPAKVKKEKTSLNWSKEETKFNLSKFERGHQRNRKETYEVNTHHYETEVDGVLVKYWPNDGRSMQAMKGRIEIEIPGTRQADTAKIFDTMETLGINSQRTTPGDIEELYLDKLAYIHKVDKKLSNATRAMTDQQERIKYKKQEISKEARVKLEGNPLYNPSGEYQAFGHGRRIHFRPELLNDPDFKKFEKEYRLVHRNTDNGSISDTIKAVLSSGGQMISTTDKIRRGVKLGGMSYQEDLHSGGANYFFTRIQNKSSAISSEGFVWKGKQAARIDAISYSGDSYGRTTDNYVQQHRKTSLKQLESMSTKGSNETILKDSLSIFDDLERINVTSEKERQKVISIFKEAGYQNWPDGRNLEDVIKLTGKK